MIARALAALLLAATLVACGNELELPPAQPLTANPEQLAQIPYLAPGPHAVHSGGPVDWSVAGRELRLRVVRPDADGQFPLVVFSHGFAADGEAYDAVLDHWASHGFISMAPWHADSGGTARAIFASLRHGKAGLIASRLADLRLVLDNIDALDAVEPGLSQRIDRKRILAAGHSFGAFSAQQLGGAVAIDPEDGNRVAGRDPRVRAVLAISPPGEMFGLINAQSWETMAVPMLATTGTWDIDGRFVTDWRQHALSYESAPQGRNRLLVIQGADHYLGNLICRLERDAPPQHDALRMLNAVGTAYLAEHAGRDGAPTGRELHQRLADLTGGFATLSLR